MDSYLQSENYYLRQQLEALLHEARQNENKMRQFDQLQRQLIGAGSLSELIHLLLSEYKLAFGVEVVTLALVDREYEVSRILESDPGNDTACSELALLQSPAALEALYSEIRGPYLGAFNLFGFNSPLLAAKAVRRAAAFALGVDTPQLAAGRFITQHHQTLFNTPLGAIVSVALLPLTRHGELIGSLHLGSANPERYVAGCRTDFLERLAEIMAICLESALSQERLKLLGLTDALTGVQNRRYFEHRCQVEISQARRYKHPLACMFIDIDKFKSINDTYGHQTGDEALMNVAGFIQSQLRVGDTIARYGGEEFVVLLPRTDMHHASQIAERIRCCIAEEELHAHSGELINLTISIGLSMLPAEGLAVENLQLADQMVAAADKALYQAKHGGRNRVVCDGSLPAETLQHTHYGWMRLPAAWVSCLQKAAPKVTIAVLKVLKRTWALLR